MTSPPLRKRLHQEQSEALEAPDVIRARFSDALSSMYREEVPQYGTLLELVADINAAAVRRDPSLLAQGPTSARLDVERHGAIRLGSPYELSTIRRIFAVMGMHPVGYYDLSVAGVPVHSTAFRPVDSDSLAANPFRVFTSLLRLELIRDPTLKDLAAEILRKRSIFTARALELTLQSEVAGGLTKPETAEFIDEVLQTFRWHDEATVTRDTYERLHSAHRLIADVVCFKGPHINHLTPRTLDIDTAQAEMPLRGIAPKENIEGPPPRNVPILLRQTSFKALEEPVRFALSHAEGAHTARFGEIEQRGLALTHKGRALYDALLQLARSEPGGDAPTPSYQDRLADAFKAFPDTLESLRREQLGFFRYALLRQTALPAGSHLDIDDLVDQGIVSAIPITYEDFLPVSAAGIFQSNLGDAEPKTTCAESAQSEFEHALGAPVLDPIALYQAEQDKSRLHVMREIERLGTQRRSSVQSL